MDTQKRIIIWVSSILIIGVTGIAVWQTSTNPQKPKPKAGILSEMVTPEEWVKGATTTPKATLVEYSDFQCPACGLWYSTIEKVVAEQGSSLAFVYRHFPLPQHLNANIASYASEAAGMQGKFWEMHEMLFKNQREWSNSTTARTLITGYAQKIGLDMVQFETDIDSDAVKNAVKHDKETGMDSGVNSTPSFYLNGKKISPEDAQDFEKIILEAIK